MSIFYKDLFKDENKAKLDHMIAFAAVAHMSNIQYERKLAEPLLFDKDLFLTVAQKYDMDVEISDEEYKLVYDFIQDKVNENNEELAGILVNWVSDEKTQKIMKEIEEGFEIPLLKDMGNFIQDFIKDLEDQEQASKEEEHILREDYHIQDRPLETTFKLFSYLVKEASKQEINKLGGLQQDTIARDICREETWRKDFDSWEEDELKQLFDIDKPLGYGELLDFYMYEPNQELMQHVLEEAIDSHEDNAGKNIVNLEEGIWAKLRQISLTEEQRSTVEQAHKKFLAFRIKLESWQREEDKELESWQQEEDREREPSQWEAQDKEAFENYKNAKEIVDSLTTQEAVDGRVAQYFERGGDENNFLKQYWALAKYELSQAEGTGEYVKMKQTVTDFLGKRMIPKFVDDIMSYNISDRLIEDLVGDEAGKDDRARLEKEIASKLQEQFVEALGHVFVMAHPVMEEQEYGGLLKFISNYSESTEDPVARRIEAVQEEKLWKQREHKAKAELEELIQRNEDRIDDVLKSPGSEDIRQYIRNVKRLEEEERRKLQENGGTQEQQEEFENFKEQLNQSSADLIMSRMKDPIKTGISGIDLEGMARSQDKAVIENLKKQIQSDVEKHIYDKILSILQKMDVLPENPLNFMSSESKVEEVNHPQQTEVQNTEEKPQDEVEKPKPEEKTKPEEKPKPEEEPKPEVEPKKEEPLEGKNLKEQAPLDSEFRMVDLDAVEMNRNLHSLLEQLRDADPFYIRSSPEFKKMKNLLTTMVRELDNRGEFLDSDGIRELAADMKELRTYTEEYLAMKHKEENPSDNALRRMAVANRIRNAAVKYVAPLSAILDGNRVEVVRDTDKLEEVLQQSRRQEAQEVETMPEGLGKDIAQNALLARERLEQYACSKVSLSESQQRDAKGCLHFLISNRLVQMQIKKQPELNLEEEAPKIIEKVSQMEVFNVDRYTKDPKSIAEFLNNHMENKMIKECIATIAQTSEHHEQVERHSHPQLNQQENANKNIRVR